MTTTELTPNQICEAFPQSVSHVTDRTIALCIQYLMDDPRNVRYLEMERIHPAFIRPSSACGAPAVSHHTLCVTSLIFTPTP
jgi:hypothetical protein